MELYKKCINLLFQELNWEFFWLILDQEGMYDYFDLANNKMWNLIQVYTLDSMHHKGVKLKWDMKSNDPLNISSSLLVDLVLNLLDKYIKFHHYLRQKGANR